jgi:hypothetical protein
MHERANIAPDKKRLGTMRPAGRFLDLLAVELIEAGIGIGLQHASEVGQVRSRALALTIGTVTEEHRRRIDTSRRAIIAHIRPEPPLLGSAAAGAQYRHRGVIAVDLGSSASAEILQRLNLRRNARGPAYIRLYTVVV